MKVHINIQNRIIPGILLILFIYIFFFILINRQNIRKDQLIKDIRDNYHPSLTALRELEVHCKGSVRMLIAMKISCSAADSLYNADLNSLFGKEIPRDIVQLSVFSSEWDDEDRDLFISLIPLIRDTLSYKLKNLSWQLPKDRSISPDPQVYEASPELISLSSLVTRIGQTLEYLIEKHKGTLAHSYSLIEEISTRVKNIIITFFILNLLVIISFFFYNAFYTKRSLNKVNKHLTAISQGMIPEPLKTESDDEFGEIFKLLNKITRDLKNLTDVLNRILKNDFRILITPASDKDKLGNTLYDLQNNLKRAGEEDLKRKKEDSERNWATEGLVRINEILRRYADNLEELSDNLIREMVKYTSSKAGAFYILNTAEDKDPFIELSAAYACGEEIIKGKKILIGEGLVGRSFQENETILLTDVPEGFIKIRSGLGEDEPSNVLIVPIHQNDIVYGVIELASFQNFEPFQVSFVEAVSESIAATIIRVKINLKTSQLLSQMKLQAEKMTAREEEMQLKIHEMQSLQVQSALREEKLKEEIEILRQKLREK